MAAADSHPRSLLASPLLAALNATCEDGDDDDDLVINLDSDSEKEEGKTEKTNKNGLLQDDDDDIQVVVVDDPLLSQIDVDEQRKLWEQLTQTNHRKRPGESSSERGEPALKRSKSDTSECSQHQARITRFLSGGRGGAGTQQK